MDFNNPLSNLNDPHRFSERDQVIFVAGLLVCTKLNSYRLNDTNETNVDLQDVGTL